MHAFIATKDFLDRYSNEALSPDEVAVYLKTEVDEAITLRDERIAQLERRIAGSGVGDVVERQGQRGWVRGVLSNHLRVELHDSRSPLWQVDECTVVARCVYDLRTAMDLIKDV